MSSIDFKARDVIPTAKSDDGKIILSYLIVAVGIFFAFYAISVSPEPGPIDFASLSLAP